jgi:hypothetical protein
MPDFLVESYVADLDQAISALGRARRLRTPRLLSAVHLPGDEVFLAFWEADDETEVGEATRKTGLPLDRIVPAHELAPRRARR